MSFATAKLADVAPAKALKKKVVGASDLAWHLNLDQVESQTGCVLEEKIAPVSEAGNSTHWFDERHVLYSKLRPYLNKVVVPEKEGIATTELVPMLPDPELLDRKYLAHYLRSNQFVHWISAQVAGAKMPRVSMKVFWEHEIPLPPLAEQQRIAAILDKADALRRKRQQAIDLADQFLRSVFLDMFGDPVSNPKGWPMGTIRDLVSEAKYGTAAKADTEKGEFPILRMGNLTYRGALDLSNLKYVDLEEKDQPKYLACDGDLLFNRTNSKELVGKTAVYDLSESMAIAGYLIRVRTNENGSPYYISAYLNSAHGKATLVGMCKSIVGMANINAQELQDIHIMLPPIDLQHKFSDISKEVKARLEKHTRSLFELSQLFSSLSQQAFSGEL